MKKTIEEQKREVIEAGKIAVDELIIVAKEKIINNDDEDLGADKLKNAAATKKLCIVDAFDILNRITEEENTLNDEAGLGGGKKIFTGITPKK